MRLLIVDDEALARARLRRLVEALGEGYEVAGEAASGEQALALCAGGEVDLVLLDIRMPGMDGLAASARMAEGSKPPAVVFTTAYDQFAVQAFEHNAVGYLLKPVRSEELVRALNRARALTRPQLQALERLQPESSGRSHVCALYRGDLRSVPIEQVRYFRAEAKYVVAHFGAGELLLEEPLKSLEQDFGTRLLRIHRNALVARDYVEALEKGADERWRIRLRGGDVPLEVSRRHLPAVRQWLRGRG